MSLSKLNNLYREVILDHANHPHHKGELVTATNQITLNNPTCGDVINLTMELNNHRIQAIKFTGDGCTISQASASMMADVVTGKTMAEALVMVKTFSDMVMGKKHDPVDLKVLKDAAILANVVSFPARIKCATLAWWALQRALLDEQDTRED